MESHIACPEIREIEQQTYDGTLIISKIKPGMNLKILVINQRLYNSNNE